MVRFQTRRNTGTGVPASIQHVFSIMALRVIEQRLDSRLRKAPCTSVKWFLLRPDNVLSVRIHVKVLPQLRPGKGVELLNTRDGGIGDLLLGAVPVQRGVDLACAQDYTFDLLGCVDDVLLVRWIPDDPLEVAFTCEIFGR